MKKLVVVSTIIAVIMAAGMVYCNSGANTNSKTSSAAKTFSGSGVKFSYRPSLVAESFNNKTGRMITLIDPETDDVPRVEIRFTHSSKSAKQFAEGDYAAMRRQKETLDRVKGRKTSLGQGYEFATKCKTDVSMTRWEKRYYVKTKGGDMMIIVGQVLTKIGSKPAKGAFADYERVLTTIRAVGKEAS